MTVPLAIRSLFRVLTYFVLFVTAALIPARTHAAPQEPTATPSTSLSPEAKKKLSALDAALKNGVLTKEEYQAKKNALYAEASAQAATAGKLEALDKAYQSGVLTKEEYERKKKELTGAATSRGHSDSDPAPRADTGTTRSGWATHEDPAGFSVDVPPGWNLTKDAGPGRITLRGQRGEQAVIWPMFVEGKQVDTREAGTLVDQLARNVDGQMSWGKAEFSQNVARAIAKNAHRSATALMTWSGDPKGTSVFFYCVEAPADVYRSTADSFARILQSFRVLQDPALKNVSAREATSNAPLRFVTWADPRENAFTMAVPQGWQILGGAYRLSASDIRTGVVMVSPDSRIRVIFGDSTIGTFTEPNQMLAMAGLREGAHQALGDGTQLEIRRYLSGQQFARAYAQGFAQRQCSGLNIVSNNMRPDLASTFLQSARAEGTPRAQLTAGDVAITCNLNGTPVSGFLVVATIAPFPGQSGIWSVYRLYGYIAPPERRQEAEAVYQQALQTWRINPQWQAREQQIANDAVQQDNARSQQIRARAMQAIQDDQRHISDTIMKGWEERSKVYDEISRRQENAILGTLDVVDSESGARYKVDNYSDYHWMNNAGYMAGTSTHTSPGPDWRELVTLPY